MLLWLVIGGCLVAFLLSLALNWIALGPWRRCTNHHWAERARLLYPARSSAALNVLLITANVVEIEYFIEPGFSACWLTLVILTFFSALLGTFWLSQAIFPRITFKRWLKNLAEGWSLRYGILLVYLLCAAVMPKEFGWPAIAVTAGALLFHWIQLSRWRTRWMLWAGLLRPPGDRLKRIVEETCSCMNVPVSSVWQLTGFYGQAYALPVTRELYFSDRLMEICDDREVAAICAHELGHLTESKAVLFRRIAGTFVLFPLLFLRPMFAAGGAWFPVLLVPTLLLLLLNKKLSVRMEKRADQIATDNQADPGVYGRALEKIYQENVMPAVTGRRHPTHPDLYDRLTAAGIVPDYPRPKPARKYHWSSLVLYVVLIVALIIYASLPDLSRIPASWMVESQ